MCVYKVAFLFTALEFLTIIIHISVRLHVLKFIIITINFILHNKIALYEMLHFLSLLSWEFLP